MRILSSSPRLKYLPGTVNIVFEGNSLVYGNGATGGNTFPDQTIDLPPVSGNATYTNTGQNGWNFDYMLANSSAINALFDVNKTNVLVVWEGTNTIFGQEKTATQTFNDTATLCTNRLAVHPWLIVLMTTLPRESYEADQAGKNASLIEYDDMLRANYRAIGAKGLVDVRQAGSPFGLITSPYADSNFDSAGAYWDIGTAGYRVHLNDAGYGLIAEMTAATLRRLPAR